jgi:hypothetical protein
MTAILAKYSRTKRDEFLQHPKEFKGGKDIIIIYPRYLNNILLMG